MSQKKSPFHFFSYGSNLLIERIKSRVPSVDHAPESRIGYSKGVSENIKLHKELNPKVWER